MDVFIPYSIVHCLLGYLRFTLILAVKSQRRLLYLSQENLHDADGTLDVSESLVSFSLTSTAARWCNPRTYLRARKSRDVNNEFLYISARR